MLPDRAPRPPVVAVNGRFLTMPVTGAQRYARELVSRLRLSGDLDVLLVTPDGRAGRSWSGPRGHAWEQAVLPGRAARLAADVLLSLCNSGPLRGIPQVVGLLDASPYLRPDDFAGAYVRWVRFAWPRLARRARCVVTLSDRTASELGDALGLRPDQVAVVPPGVGSPFTDREPARGPRSHRCVFVGGHDPRKNLAFLLDLWPEVHTQLGLELVVVRRGASRPHATTPTGLPPGVGPVEDPDDGRLADLYATSLCVLSPSHYEGFGLPLLEGMATGTPFLATDTGAARDLAVEPGQILPLDREAWLAGLRWMASGAAAELGERGRAAARARTWERSTAILAGVLAGRRP